MSVLYVYGFAPPATELPPGGLLGVGDAEIELVPYDGFAAVVGRLPEDEYAGEALERHGTDVEWMAEQGLRHEQVVAWFVDHASILPSRLLTLFSSRAALDARAHADADRVRAALDRFAGLREWDLKVGFEAAVLEEHLGEVSDEIRRLDAEMEAAAPGRAFLLRKKRADLARTEARAAAVRLARQLLDDIAAHAVEVARLTPPADQAPVVLNAAVLLSREREGAALEVAERETDRLGRLGLVVRYTGPWAPYRFIEGPHE